jgi:alkylated DNA repair dioxygenase AlkB
MAMKDLFTLDRQFEPIPMPDADVSMLHEVEMPLPYDMILQKLMDQTIWRQESVKIYGKDYQQPRLVALYGDAGMRYDYSGISLHPLPWTDFLREVKRRIQECTNAAFNAVFLNLYRDHNDSMGFHSDDEKDLGREPTIASGITVTNYDDRCNNPFIIPANRIMPCCTDFWHGR